MSSTKEKLFTWYHSPAVSSFKSLYPLIWPLLLSMVTRAFITPINTAFAGRVGTVDLGAVGISFGLVTVTATGLGSGLAVSFETMAARSYGAQEYHNVGVLLQKAFIFASFQCALVTALWIHLGVVLKAIGVPPLMADLSEQYLIMYIPALLGIFMFRLLRAYLIVLRSVIPSFIVAFVGVVLLIPFNFLFVYLFDLGVVGIAISTDASNALTVLFIFMYIVISGIYKQTWAGFSKKCFLDWKSYLDIAGPGAFNFLFKSTIHEIALIVIGRLGDVAVAGQTALFTVNKTLLTIPLAIGMPMNINISKHFGEGKAKEAKTTAIVGSCFNLILSIIVTLVLLASNNILGYIFSNDVEVITLVAKTVPFAASSFLLESITSVFFIICVAVRLQVHSIVVYLISAYTIGLPLGLTLALRFKDITYLWFGLSVGFLVQMVMFSVLFWWKVDFVELSQVMQHDSFSAECSEYEPLKTIDSSDEETERQQYEQKTEKKDKDKNEKHEESKKEISDKNETTKVIEVNIDDSIDKDMDCKTVKNYEEQGQDDQDQEVTREIICKKLLILATSIAILIISIIIKLNYSY